MIGDNVKKFRKKKGLTKTALQEKPIFLILL